MVFEAFYIVWEVGTIKKVDEYRPKPSAELTENTHTLHIYIYIYIYIIT